MPTAAITRNVRDGLSLVTIGRFYTRGRVIRLDELSSVARLERRKTEDCSSRCIMRLVPVSLTSSIVISVPTRALLAVETKGSFVQEVGAFE